MKERLTSIKLFLVQHFFVVGLVLLFVVLSLCSCGRAAADSMIQSDRDYIHSVFDSFWGENEWATVEDYMDSMPYFIIFKESGGSNYVLYLSPFSTNDYYEARYVNGDAHATGVSSVNIIPWLSNFTNQSNQWSFGTSYGGLIPYSLGNLEYSSSKGKYGYAIFTSATLNGTYIGYRVDIANDDYSSSTWNRYWYDSTLHGISNFTASAGRFGMYVDLSWTKTNFNAAVILGEYTSEYSCEQNVFPVEYVSDERLKLSTSLTGDGFKILNIDLSAFRGNYTPAASYSFSDVVLHLNCDGSDVSYTINDFNSELINTWTPSNNRYVFITPYSVFDLDSYVDVYISGVDFSLSHSSPGGSDTDDFKISVEYFLKHETAPIESDDISYDSDTETLKLTTAEIDSKNDVVNLQNYYYSQTGGGGQELDIPEGFTVKLITVYSSGTLADALNNLDGWALFRYPINTLVNLGIVAISDITSISNTNDFNDFMESDIHDNSYGAYYDIVCYYWIPPASSGEVDAFYYYITSSGKLRTVNQTLADIWQESNQIAYNTSALYDYTYNKLNDFENKTLVGFNSLIGLDRQEVQWLSTLNNTLDTGFISVVDAINNIDIPQPVVFDDSDILDKIDDLITAVQGLIDGNEVDTPQECIQYYYDNQNGTIDLAFVPAYYEGMTLDFLYSIQGDSQNNNRSGTKSGGGSATFVNDTLIIQIFQQFKESFNQNSIPQNIRVFLSNITNDTGNHMYYFQLFHNDYDPEDFDGLAD